MARLRFSALVLVLLGCSDDPKGEQDQDPSTGVDAAVDAAAPVDATQPIVDARVTPVEDATAPILEDASVVDAGTTPEVMDAGMVREGPTPGLLRLVDFETGALQKGTAAHDGVLTTYANCGNAKPTVAAPEFAYGEHALRVAVPASALAKGGCFNNSSYLNVGVEVLGSRNDAMDLRADETYWIGFAVYLPADTKNPKDDGWRLFELHDLPGNGAYSAIYLALNADLTWRVGRDGAVLDGHADKKFGRAAKGEWQELVLRVVPSYDAKKGALRVWHRVRGEAFVQVDDYAGRTVAAANQFPNYVNLAAYHNATSNGDSMDPRTFFYDELRVGDHRVGFDDVAPGAKTTPP